MATLVTVHVWQARSIGPALAALVRDRRSLRSVPGLSFAKLLGTSRDYSLRGADLHRWVLIAAWTSRAAADAFDAAPLATRRRRAAEQSWRGVLRPLSSRGHWSGRAPFESDPTTWNGPVAAITRARIAPRQLAQFWRAAAPIAREAWQHKGLLAGMGIGEAPIAYQGTFTMWASAAELTAFAYAGAAHREAIERTASAGWYAEELFARCAIVDSYGTIDGCDPLSRFR